MEEIKVMVADASHEKYVDTILQTIADAAKVRGTGIAKRTHEYLTTKMKEAKAVIALSGDRFAGFSYIETWGNKQYVTTSGLIVHPDFRKHGVAKRIKDLTFTLARTRWPPVGLSSRDVCRPHRRRSLLARMRRLHQRRRAQTHRAQVLHLHRHALRPRGAPARQAAAGGNRENQQDRQEKPRTELIKHQSL